MTDLLANLASPARANVLGVGVHAINMQQAVEVINSAVAERRRGYICVTGVHGVMEAQQDPTLIPVLADALLVVPDGMPTVWMGHLQGFCNMDRVFGPDLMIEVAWRSQARRYSHFFYGGGPGVADELRAALQRRCPSMRIAGTYTPPYRKLTDAEEFDLLRTVDRLQPDIIWVGLSTPKQERFMAEYLPRLNTTLMIGVGAAFDFHTGRIKDSPPWLKRAGLQWLHRFIQEPSRLWKRYLLSNPEFIFQAGLQLAGLRRYSLSEAEFSPSVGMHSVTRM
jgi:N-acetylglucosaminyldiphosphoundecaprenol N-acetyl-beta-D-mannosaminyltransferase